MPEDGDAAGAPRSKPTPSSATSTRTAAGWKARATTTVAARAWARTATTIDECRQIVEAQRKSGEVYMMMETVVYSREFLFIKELYERASSGRIQFMRGSHQQDMDGWPGYWEGFPRCTTRRTS